MIMRIYAEIFFFCGCLLNAIGNLQAASAPAAAAAVRQRVVELHGDPGKGPLDSLKHELFYMQLSPGVRAIRKGLPRSKSLPCLRPRKAEQIERQMQHVESSIQKLDPNISDLLQEVQKESLTLAIKGVNPQTAKFKALNA